jgi:hypothetical protein
MGGSGVTVLYDQTTKSLEILEKRIIFLEETVTKLIDILSLRK